MIMSGQLPIGEDPDMPFDTRGVLMLDMDPPKHTRYRLLVNKGFTPRMIGLIEQALQHRATVDRRQRDRERVGRLRRGHRRRAAAPGDRRDHGRPAGGSAQAVRLDRTAWSAPATPSTWANDTGRPRSSSSSPTPTSSRPSGRSDPRDDIVTKLLNAEIEGEQLSELEFDMFILLLAVAGNETTRNATAHGMHALLDQPRPVRAAQERPRRPHRRRDRGGAAVGVAGAALPPHRDHRHRDPRPRRSRQATGS